MIEKCKCCSREFEHGNSGNMIIFCPYCKKSAGAVSDYGFGPIVPCDIYLGDKIIARITSMDSLVSEEFGIQRTLSGEYSDLKIYQEATEIIGEILARDQLQT